MSYLTKWDSTMIKDALVDAWKEIEKIKQDKRIEAKRLEIGASQLPRNDERYHYDPSRFYWDPSTRRYEERPFYAKAD